MSVSSSVTGDGQGSSELSSQSQNSSSCRAGGHVICVMLWGFLGGDNISIIADSPQERSHGEEGVNGKRRNVLRYMPRSTAEIR